MEIQDKKHYLTVVISDIHIGSKWSHTREATEFLMNISCDKLILNGDIFDGWHLIRSRKKWNKLYNEFIKIILEMLPNTQIIYVRGNHDDFLDYVVPFSIDNFSIVTSYIHESCGKRYFVFHGDLFDNVTSNFRWISKAGDKLYSMLLQISRLYNDVCRRNEEYFSLSKVVKRKVKQWVNKASSFDKNIIKVARKNNCQGVICGHIHHAEIKDIENILYINSGDWIESLTAAVEDSNGSWSIIKIPRDERHHNRK